MTKQVNNKKEITSRVKILIKDCNRSQLTGEKEK